ncbi:YfhO family protein [Cognatilysobacter bugurensis]|uniref:YfhO family protein n=1 Tax=Cognatilysobacter bugurensis TaxID=543356 RepID=A0A918W8G8_9GAMM|nr:YfhO family protein [Lysobacter bugurensis]GHA85654.1 hypothetical protein GCM10007067_24630 [Lysobacter bugurensis]
MIKTSSPSTGRGASSEWRQRVLPWVALVAAFFGFYGVYFAPAFMQGLLLAPGDGAIYYAPLFGLPVTELWTGLILSGYPVIADIQAQTLYPLRWLSPTYNVLVVVAYVVAATGMFGLVHRLTHSRLAGLAGALTLSASGFMIGHLGHLSIVHAAAWVPWVLWALAALRTRCDWAPVAGGGIAVALTLLGGHPQVSVLGLLLAGFYAVHELGVIARRDGAHRAAKDLLRVTLLFTLGIMLALPSLLATLGAASESVRGSWSVTDFNSFSHDPASLRMLAFPNLYGGHPVGPYGAYAGPWNLTELAIYAGILPWFLTIAALLGWKRDWAPLFWVGVLVVALLLTLGSITPLGDALFRLPIVGKFRAQARYGLLAIIALGVLAGFGLSAILRGGLDRRRTVLLVALSFGTAVIAATTLSVADFGQAALGSAAVYVPLVMMALSLLVVAYLALRPGVNPALLALVVLVVDLGSFGWFYEWRYASPAARPADLGRDAQTLVEALREGPGRVLPLDAARMPPNPLLPNMNMDHGIASVVGYGPLLSARYARFAGTDTVGNFAERRAGIPLMDVLGVQWIARLATGSTEPQLLGSGCGAPSAQRAVHATVPADVAPRGLRIVSHLSCSPQIASGTTLADVQVGPVGAPPSAAMTLEAGEETSEWAYDRPDVRASIAHARAPVAESFDAGGGFRGLWFGARWPAAVPLPLTSGDRIEIRLRETSALMRIKAVEVLDSHGRWVALPMAPLDEAGQAQLGAPRSLPGVPAVNERRSFRGLAWGVCDIRTASADEIVALLRGGQDASGRGFDPFFTALLEPEAPLAAPTCSTRPRVQVLERGNGRWALRSEAAGDSVLVVSESYNAGWRAKIDGHAAPIVPVDGLILGVSVPAGTHEVTLQYRPRRFLLSLAAAALALLAVGAMLIASGRRASRSRAATLKRNAS